MRLWLWRSNPLWKEKQMGVLACLRRRENGNELQQTTGRFFRGRPPALSLSNTLLVVQLSAGDEKNNRFSPSII
jgi:hypothetical protein